MVTGTVVHVEVPTGLYSMFQAVSVPVETQLTVAETSPMLETETLDGLVLADERFDSFISEVSE